MKVAIWQQFSSNHSADFTIVGVFESVEKAREASHILRTELVKIAMWFEDPANAERIQKHYEDFANNDEREPLPPEKSLDDKYGAGFTYNPTDWLNYTDEAERAVIRFENMVFISNWPTSFRTWSGSEPFEKLLHAAGGKVGCECIVVTCEAPDIETAKRLYTTLIERSKGSKDYPIAPRLDLAHFNTEPEDNHFKIIFYPDGYVWDDLKELRRFLSGYKDVQYKVYLDCADVE